MVIFSSHDRIMVAFFHLLIGKPGPSNQERDAALRSELQAINDKFLRKRKKVRFFLDEAFKRGGKPDFPCAKFEVFLGSWWSFDVGGFDFIYSFQCSLWLVFDWRDFAPPTRYIRQSLQV